MSEGKHISKNEFDLFKHNLLSSKEKLQFLEHISNCDFCSDQFAAMMSEEIIEAPLDFKANVLKARKRLDVQIAKKHSETSERLQLLIYSLKVGTATVLALLLLIFTMNPNEVIKNSHLSSIPKTQDTRPINHKLSFTSVIRDRMDSLTDSMSDFSNNIMNMEDNKNDTKKE